MTKYAIQTENAPIAAGPYSQGVRSGAIVVVSGQLPIDTTTGSLISDDIGTATRLCLENTEAILAKGGADLDDLVQITIYLANIDDFGAMNTAYSEFFSDASITPARVCIEVAALPKGARIEIAAMAHVLR
jgi:2-iminobutanoate/2-iminopropanoate deaminase